MVQALNNSKSKADKKNNVSVTETYFNHFAKLKRCQKMLGQTSQYIRHC